MALAYLPKVFTSFIAIGFGLGAIAIVRYPDGVLTDQARRVRVMLAQIRLSSPLIYSRLKVAGVVTLVVTAALLIWVQGLWWLWLAIAFVLVNAAFGYIAFKVKQLPDSVADQEILRTGVLEPIEVG